jgi:hypothetical protein
LQTSGLKYREFYSTLLWLSISAVSYYLVHLKFLALDFHTRDYAFYTEFIIKWSRPVSEQQYSINPGGYNFLGISSTDGCSGFYQWIHFEPIRFVQAFIYKIFHSLQAVFIFNSLLVCSPVLAITRWLSKTSAKLWEYFIWVLLFAAFPATLLAAGYDNRPSMFLGVGYFWLLYSLLATKNTWLQFLFFVLLLTIREEALILNACVLGYLFFEWRKKEVSGKWFFMFMLIWGIYLIGLLSYFRYWNYTFFEDTGKKYTLGILVSCILGVLGIAGFILLRKKYRMILFIPVILFIFQLLSMYEVEIFPEVNFAFYNDPRLLMIFLMLLGGLLYARSLNKNLSKYVFALIPLFFIGLLFGNSGLIQRAKIWEAKQIYTREGFHFSDRMNINYDIIITDYTTHQMFLGKKNLYCIDRLPCYIEKSPARFYPENRGDVEELMKECDWYIYSGENKLQFDTSKFYKVFEEGFFTIIDFNESHYYD